MTPNEVALEDRSGVGIGLAMPQHAHACRQSGLWAEYARLVGELRPRYVLVENVAGLLVRGFGRVLGDLADLGYDAEWDCLPAAHVGAPHLRLRLWLVAYPAGERDGLASRVFSAGRDEPEHGAGWEPEPDVGRVAHGVPARVDRLRCLGNALVPQIAEWIGSRVIQYELHGGLAGTDRSPYGSGSNDSSLVSGAPHD